MPASHDVLLRDCLHIGCSESGHPDCNTCVAAWLPAEIPSKCRTRYITISGDRRCFSGAGAPNTPNARRMRYMPPKNPDTVDNYPDLPSPPTVGVSGLGASCRGLHAKGKVPLRLSVFECYYFLCPCCPVLAAPCGTPSLVLQLIVLFCRPFDAFPAQPFLSRDDRAAWALGLEPRVFTPASACDYV